ncbi:MAG TPA: hypothetical protein DCQ98_08430 [Planctomycetaceae bacterium]|nr:hypothetical protein [Planctomycetaceae bacterium]
MSERNRFRAADEGQAPCPMKPLRLLRRRRPFETLGLRKGRRGSLYVPVLGTCVVAGLLATTLMMVERTRSSESMRRSLEEQARLMALGGLSTQRQAIADSPSWRSAAVDGRIATSIDFGNGRCELEIFDPNDGDLIDSVDDPYVIVATGVAGQARHSIRCGFADRGELPEACVATVATAGTLSLSSADVRGDAELYASGAIAASGGTILSRVAATGGTVGTFADRALSGVASRSFPSPSAVDATLRTSATEISVAAIPTEGANLIANGAFETASTPWTGLNELGQDCVVERSTQSPRTGVGCLKVKDRSIFTEGPVLSILPQLESGKSYRVRVWVRCPGATRTFQLVVGYRTTGAVLSTYALSSLESVGPTWKLLTLDFTPTWSGTLGSAVLRVQGALLQGNPEFFIDDVELVETWEEIRLERVLLSSASNPFGATNADGIYRLDCNGKRLVVRQSRLVATLLVEDPGAGSRIGDEIAWSPARDDLPALVVVRTAATSGRTLKLEPNGSVLHEPATTTNFNPVGTPAPDGSVDSTTDDTYETRFSGMLLIDGPVAWNGHAILNAPLIATGSVTISGSMSLEPNRLLERLRPAWLSTRRVTAVVGEGLEATGR